MKKTPKKQRRASATITTTRNDDGDSDTYSNSLYARRNSLMAKPTVPRNVARRRHSMSTVEDKHGGHLTAKEKVCAFLHIGNRHHQNQQQQQHPHPQQSQKQIQQKKQPPASQYTYYQEPPDSDNRHNPLRQFFNRRRRHSDSTRANAKNELLVAFALGKGLMLND